MKVSVYFTDTSYVALDMLKGYLRIHDPVLFERIEWQEFGEDADKRLFFIDEIADLERKAQKITAVAARSVPCLKMIMTQEKIKFSDPTVKGWSLDILHDFLRL